MRTIQTFLMSLCLIPGAVGQGIMTTVAGGGALYLPNQVPPRSLAFGELSGVTGDERGNVYAADARFHIVVKIPQNGAAVVIAGNGLPGFSGDGGLATSASLNRPRNLTVDRAGNLFICDYGNNRVRKVTPEGIISTVAGGGTRAPGANGPALTAQLNGPAGIAVDSAGNMYIADSLVNRLRKVDPAGFMTSLASLDLVPGNVRGAAVDAQGNAYFASPDYGQVRKVDPTGNVSVFAGSTSAVSTGDAGQATAARLVTPTDVAIDETGNVHICEAARIRKVLTNGVIATVVGSGVSGSSGDNAGALQATIDRPVALYSDARGNLLFAESGRVRQFLTLTGYALAVAGGGPQKGLGDGGPASAAGLFTPSGIVIDSNGNVYFSDFGNHRVRKISPSGVITTVAGNGERGFGGDGEPGVVAALSFPLGLALDSAGNLYIADSGNHRIRRLSPAGILQTVAGGGLSSELGDSGPATSANLSSPTGVAVDASGNLLIADRDHGRIRKVDGTGKISTFAGGGTSTAENVAATIAGLAGPTDLAIDGDGNVLFSESSGNRIRRINGSGLISTIAGILGSVGFNGDGGLGTRTLLNGPGSIVVERRNGFIYFCDQGNRRVRRITSSLTVETFAGSGTTVLSDEAVPADSASFAVPKGIAFDSKGNLYITDAGYNRIRKVFNTAPSFVAAPTQLTFRADAATGTPAPQDIVVSSELGGLFWAATASTQSGGDWLKIANSTGTAPGTVAISVNRTELASGDYTGTITVTAPDAVPNTQVVAVKLTISAASPTSLTAEPAGLTFETQAGVSTPVSQIVRIGNPGPGTVDWTAQATAHNGGNWLTVAESSGTAAADKPGSLTITAQPTGLAAGAYSGSVTLTASTLNQSVKLPITLLVSSTASRFALSQSGLYFAAVQGGASPSAQTLSILNLGTGTVSWNASASALPGNWLSVAAASGNTGAGSASVLTISVNHAGLSAGSYTGRIRVTGGEATRQVTVYLRVLASANATAVDVRPGALFFQRTTGTSSPNSRLLTVTALSSALVTAKVIASTSSGGSWLTAVPSEVVVSAAQSASVIVQPVLSTLSPGLYSGKLTFNFSDGSVQGVAVYFLVTPPAPCTPTRTVPVLTTLPAGRPLLVGQPVSLQVQVRDDCGNSLNNAEVRISFSQGDPAFSLLPLGSGTYEREWQPLNAAPLAGLRVRAATSNLVGELEYSSSVAASPDATIILPGGIVNAASFAASEPLAPGGIVSVFGRGMASAAGGATALPLPVTLNGATLSIGGQDVPLFYSSAGQINAQLPVDLAPNSRPQAVVSFTRAGLDTLSLPETLTIVPARPGIFQANSNGQGVVVDTQGRLVDASASAAAGDVVVIYATGLGATSPGAQTGQPSPSAPAGQVTTPVEVRIGGQVAGVQFAGLTPGLVGLYQINVQVPSGIPAGSAVPMVITQAGTTSNTVTIAMR